MSWKNRYPRVVKGAGIAFVVLTVVELVLSATTNGLSVSGWALAPSAAALEQSATDSSKAAKKVFDDASANSLKALTNGLASVLPRMSEINERRIGQRDVGTLVVLRQKAIRESLQNSDVLGTEANSVFGLFEEALKCRDEKCGAKQFDAEFELEFCRMHQSFRSWVDRSRMINYTMYSRVVKYGNSRDCEAVISSALRRTLEA